MISNLRKNLMGTVSFDGKLGAMRKVADFIVYPMAQCSHVARIQSDNYCGKIDMRNGDVYLAKGGYSFGAVSLVGQLSADDLKSFVDAVKASASPKAGNNGIVYCDNSGAAYV